MNQNKVKDLIFENGNLTITGLNGNIKSYNNVTLHSIHISDLHLANGNFHFVENKGVTVNLENDNDWTYGNEEETLQDNPPDLPDKKEAIDSLVELGIKSGISLNKHIKKKFKVE